MATPGAFVLRYSPFRLMVSLVLYLGLSGGLIGYLLSDIDTALPVWVLLIVAAIFAWQAVRHALILATARGPILMMSDEGLDIHKPAIGPVPWNRVEAIDLGSAILSRNVMTIFFDSPPAEKPAGTWLYYPLAKALLNDPASFQLNLFMTGGRVPDLQDALARYWPGAEQPVKYED